MTSPKNSRIYKYSESIVFSKTDAPFGGLSNMAPGYPLFVNDNIIPSSEALYQAMRFPLFPDIQHEIISQSSPMTAKMISRKYSAHSRQDWDEIRIKVMRWCLEVKLSQHWTKFSTLLNETGTKHIVEFSAKDKIWGATKKSKDELEGVNALGRLLMELREKYTKPNHKLDCIEPLDVTGFLLFGHPIEITCNEDFFLDVSEIEEPEFVKV